MSDFKYENIGAMHFDVLKEIGNIGAGNATTALSKLLTSKIDMQVPMVEFLEFKNLASIVGGEETLVVGILLTLANDVEGMMMFIMEKSSALNLVNMLMGKKGEENVGIEEYEFSEMDLSALQEVGNIIAGSYLAAISTFTGMTITSSVPYLAIDMAGAILSVPAIEFGKVGDKALVIKTVFDDDDLYVDGNFILIPSLEAFHKIFKSLGLE